MEIPRPRHEARVRALLKAFPVVAILGARQVGKTTLARRISRRWPGESTAFDLEDAGDVARLQDPMLALATRRGLVVLDEVQRRPDIFPALRVLADRPRRPARFMVLGSASPARLRQSSESLAGHIAFHEISGFSLAPTLHAHVPRARPAAAGRADPRSDPRALLGDARPLPRAGWSSSEFARSFGVSDVTVRRYLDVLSATYVVRLLRPWSENLAKRQVKSPKVYLSDSGLLHSLLDVRSAADLERHPKVGASWEGFAIGAVVDRLRARWDECYFWATHGGAELDLLVVRGRTRLGFEMKRTTAPAVTRSMRTALNDLKLGRLDVVHAGPDTFPLAPRIRAVALRRLLEDLDPLP